MASGFAPRYVWHTLKLLPEEFLAQLESLAHSYLEHSDLIRQSGFGGGEERWRAERAPILDGIPRSGTVLDAGCANGYLVECLRRWGSERGLTLDPYGLDFSAELIAHARARLRGLESHFFVGNAWDWIPPKRFDFVYSLYDNVPVGYLAEYIDLLLNRVVVPGGRLILGSYGSRSRSAAPFDIAEFIHRNGYQVAGSSSSGVPPLTVFAWIDYS